MKRAEFYIDFEKLLFHHRESINISNYLGPAPLQRELKAETSCDAFPSGTRYGFYRIAVEGHVHFKIGAIELVEEEDNGNLSLALSISNNIGSSP